MGTMAAQLPYMGTPRMVAMGPEKIPVAVIMLRMFSAGTKLWINAPNATPAIIHSQI